MDSRTEDEVELGRPTDLSAVAKRAKEEGWTAVKRQLFFTQERHHLYPDILNDSAKNLSRSISKPWKSLYTAASQKEVYDAKTNPQGIC